MRTDSPASLVAKDRYQIWPRAMRRCAPAGTASTLPRAESESGHQPCVRSVEAKLAAGAQIAPWHSFSATWLGPKLTVEAEGVESEHVLAATSCAAALPAQHPDFSCDSELAASFAASGQPPLAAVAAVAAGADAAPHSCLATPLAFTAAAMLPEQCAPPSATGLAAAWLAQGEVFAAAAATPALARQHSLASHSWGAAAVTIVDGHAETATVCTLVDGSWAATPAQDAFDCAQGVLATVATVATDAQAEELEAALAAQCPAATVRARAAIGHSPAVVTCCATGVALADWAEPTPVADFLQSWRARPDVPAATASTNPRMIVFM